MQMLHNQVEAKQKVAYKSGTPLAHRVKSPKVILTNLAAETRDQYTYTRNQA